MGSEEYLLKKVEEFAAKAHGNQKRKYSDEPYIVHPIRVMETCRKYNSDVTVLAAALLHDVLEDTDCTKEEMFSFLSSIFNDTQASRIAYYVDELTDVYTKEAYRNMNRRKRKKLEAERMEKTSPEAQTVKYADIIDNCSEITVHDPEFATVFLNECKQLLEKMNKGNRELLSKAREIVEMNLLALWDLKSHPEHELA
jgi:(p)ppGpp synthase/HD superfamily hydrolase